MTGEGRLDEQTLMGKAPAVVARKSAVQGIPCIAVVGSRTAALTPSSLHEHGFTDVHPLIDVHRDVATDPALTTTALKTLGERIARTHLSDSGRTRRR